MKILKNNCLYILIIICSACTTIKKSINPPVTSAPIKSLTSTANQYKIIFNDGSFLAVQVSTDRVVPICEKLENGSYGFMIEILDDEDTLISAGGRMASKSKCHEWISKVKKIQSRGKIIKIVGMGTIDGPRVKGPFHLNIPSLGTFHENERMFAFEAILNEHKDCFSQFTRTCKKGDFHLPIDLFSL